MNIAQLIEETSVELEKKGIDDSRIDTELLLGHCLNMSRSQLYLHGAASVELSHYNHFKSLISRRLQREPVAYILGEREFWSRSFIVNRDVLIPRPETEFLLEKVLEKRDEISRADINCIDLCCGSGVIAIVLALELRARVVALDCSSGALVVTRQNTLRHGVDSLVETRQSDLFSALKPGQRFPLIVSNPPYVRRDDLLHHLEPEVELFEPHLALDGDEDGLCVIRRIAGEVLNYLSPGGMFFMEFGYDQGLEVQKIFTSESAGGRYFSTVKIFQDYSGNDRVLFARANP